MQCLEIQGVQELVYKMLTGVSAWPVIGRRLPTGGKKNIRQMWEFVVVGVVMQGGPFAGVRKSDKIDNLCNAAARLFPWGIPDRHNGRRRPSLAVGNTEYVKWVKEVFARTAPPPISNILVSKRIRPEFTQQKVAGLIVSAQ